MELKVQAPGRINILGEHTDYIGGFVLPAAIDKNVVFHLKSNGTDDLVNCKAINKGADFSFHHKSFSPIQEGWQNYIMGVVSELQKLGAQLPGFDASFDGSVPIGSGMSSSAALECSLAFGLNQLFDLGLTDWQLIRVCQMAEHNFVGTKCGIMDQFASIMGRPQKAMILDCQSLDFQYVPLELGDYALLLFNTNVAHSLASSEYNKRREECEEGLKIIQKHFPKVKHFRDISTAILAKAKNFLSPIIHDRCAHGVTENQRVLNAVEALKNHDLSTLGNLMYSSHNSLKNQYQVSCDELDFLVDFGQNETDILGSRMMGGGFGGCTINLVKKNAVKEITSRFAKAYQEQFQKEMTAYSVKIENGASVLK